MAISLTLRSLLRQFSLFLPVKSRVSTAQSEHGASSSHLEVNEKAQDQSLGEEKKIEEEKLNPQQLDDIPMSMFVLSNRCEEQRAERKEKEKEEVRDNNVTVSFS